MVPETVVSRNEKREHSRYEVQFARYKIVEAEGSGREFGSSLHDRQE